MADLLQKLNQFLHDPPDKCLDIGGHKRRAKEYAQLLGIKDLEEAEEADRVASSMERAFLPHPERFGLKRDYFYQSFTEIRHPLSEESLSVDGIDKTLVFKKVKEAFSEIAKETERNSGKEKFFCVWRNLLHRICENVDPELKKYVPVLPADTRIPDHSIWEHLKIASAINAFKGFQNNSLFLFSIGPVQSFIFQARKTKDFFMGSFLLSYLIFTGMTEIIEKYGPTNIIYPDLFGQPLMDWYIENMMKLKVENSFSHFITQPSIPNRFVAIIPETNPENITKLAQDMESKVKKEWECIVVDVLRKFRINCEAKVFKNHTSNFPEIYWVAFPLRKEKDDISVSHLSYYFDPDVIDAWKRLWEFAKEKSEYSPKVGLLYQLAYSATEKQMGARKNLRDFIQIEEEGKKCHICGEREGVIRARKHGLREGRYIDSTEGLCLVCFTKRALDRYLKDAVSERFKDFSFPSTAEISVSKFKEKALKEAKKDFENYVKVFKEKICKRKEIFEQIKTDLIPKLKKLYLDIENIDGEWFFTENLRKENIKKELGISVNEEDLGSVKSALKRFTDKLKQTDKDKYYAVIFLDGDNMGKWLSGELLPKIQYVYNSETWKRLPDEFKNELIEISEKINNRKKFLTPAIHASLSYALRNYSIEFVRRIIEEEHLGKLVYSGGDDVFTFVSIYELFDAMRKLRAAFSGNIRFGKETKVDWKAESGFVEKNGMYLLTMGKDATASCGVAIAHYKVPFRMVLFKARDMEEKAKSLNGKDAFGICLMKHSGEEREALSKWKYGEIDILERLSNVRRCFSKREKVWISDRFIYTLRDVFRRIENEDGNYRLDKELIKSEIKRVIRRNANGEKKERRKVADKVVDQVIKIFCKFNNIDNLLNLLEITSFTALEE